MTSWRAVAACMGFFQLVLYALIVIALTAADRRLHPEAAK